MWKQAGSKGRKKKHYAVLVISFIVSLALLVFGETALQGNMPQNIGTWVLAGALIGLGVIVPGLSPSNFLLYMGMYKAMADGIKTLDFSVILPIGIGAVACVLLLSKVMDYLFARAHGGMYHFILGVVFASTVMIIPKEYNYFSWGGALCIVTFAAGIALAFWMGKLEEKYKTDDSPAMQKKA